MPIPRHRDLIVVTTPDPDPNLLAAAFLCGYRQASQRLQPLVAEARQQALLDPLTGLRNRRAAGSHLNAAALGGAELWVAAVDAVGLKQVNNTRGRSAGDRMLQAVATVLGSVAARFPGARAFRLDGDELLLVVHDVDPGLPERVAALLSAELAAHGAAHPEEPQPAVSLGWAATSQMRPGEDVQEAAGVALTRAKLLVGPGTGSTVRSVRHDDRPGPGRADTPDQPRIPGQRTPAADRVVSSRNGH